MKYFISIFILSITSFLSASTYAQESIETGIVAHRGFWNCEEAGYAKNSIAALRCAQEAGLWGSEFDVHMTSDEVLIVYHDKRIKGKRIEKNPYSDFKDLKLENGETIPTLDAYLEQGKKYPETKLVLEIKPHSCNDINDRTVDLSIAKLSEHELLDPKKVTFISFNFHVCKRLAEKLPDFTVQYLGYFKSPKRLARNGIKGISSNHTLLRFNRNRNRYRQARKHDMSVNTWTVNKEKDINRMLLMGVDLITTDHPLQVREFMKAEGIHENINAHQ